MNRYLRNINDIFNLNYLLPKKWPSTTDNKYNLLVGDAYLKKITRRALVSS